MDDEDVYYHFSERHGVPMNSYHFSLSYTDTAIADFKAWGNLSSFYKGAQKEAYFR